MDLTHFRLCRYLSNDPYPPSVALRPGSCAGILRRFRDRFLHRFWLVAVPESLPATQVEADDLHLGVADIRQEEGGKYCQQHEDRPGKVLKTLGPLLEFSQLLVDLLKAVP